MSVLEIYDTLAHSSLAHEYVDAFQRATGLSVQLIPNGEPIPLLQFRRRENLFCNLMTDLAGSCAACQQVHMNLQRRIAENLTPESICCFAGLTELAVPIVVGEQHVATLLGGQVFLHKPTQTQFVKLTRQLRAWGLHSRLQQIKTAFLQIHVVPREQFRASIQLLTLFASLLGQEANRKLLAPYVYDRPCITSAKNFILAHAREPLHLHDVADHLHVSAHYFCKFFKKATGIGFSEFLRRARLEIAKGLLTNSMLSVNEVAVEAGFGSLSQFNRVFHRYMGRSPTSYRASLSQAQSS